MRLHHLEITAFGPFAETVEVDFDELSAAGLFLLTGPTGAGKSSVLDAVCFAIYGDVPGERSAAKRLRSDHAAPGIAPRVVLESTLAGRRFRITRSPAWQRDKRRGHGTTPQQASVVVAELIGGEWTTLSTRLDEAGQLLCGLLGMSLGQFTQVAMLPQGRFQTFLRARSEDRHRLLQQLFRTGRFEQAERWLRERRLVLGRASQQANDHLAAMLSRFSEAADVSLPDTWDLHDLAEHCDDGSLRWWCEGQHAQALAELSLVREHRAEALGTESQWRERARRSRELGTRRARVVAAHLEARSLEQSAAEVATREARVGAAQRAAVVAPVQRRAQSLAAREATLRRSAREAIVTAGVTHHDPGDPAAAREELAALAETGTREAARAEALRPREQRLRTLDDELRGLHARAEAVAARVTDAAERSLSLPLAVDSARAALEDARAARPQLVAASREAADLGARLAAHEEALRLESELVLARDAHTAAHEQLNRRHEQWLDVRERRLDSMAAEIALALAVGGSCPVCGSCEHPAPARPAAGAPDAAAERRAHRAVDDAKQVEHLRSEELRGIASALALARGRAGDQDAAQVREAFEVAGVEVARLQRLSDQVPDLATVLSDLEAESAGLREELSGATAEAAATSSGISALEAERAGLAAELAEVLSIAADTDLSGLAARLRGGVTRARVALQTIDDLMRAVAESAAGASELAETLADAGFADERAARAAELDGAQQRRLLEVNLEHERRRAVVAAVLEEDDAADLLLTPEPDLGADEAALAEAGAALEDVQAEWGRRESAATRLAELLAELDLILSAWAPQRAELGLTTRLASFVEGKSSDNAWQMRLSAYVLAYRLGQVVAAANQRLARMSDQRYSLEHTGQRGAGETRGGLSLLVRDDWSGAHRDPATLSGGETFVVSLALALGLADVIAHEAGGAEIDTLFVDEGFGSLDADTLDDVMDTLDSLRDGGRVVGVVSHVAEMRDRIPTQLRVAKSRTGSTLSTSRS